MTANNAQIIQFPAERVVREFNAPEPIEEITIVGPNPPSVDKFLDSYIDIMCGVDSALLRNNMTKPGPLTEVEQVDLDRSYILMQQAIIAYIMRYVGEKHLFHQLADAAIHIESADADPQLVLQGIVTDIKEDGTIDCHIFEEDE